MNDLLLEGCREYVLLIFMVRVCVTGSSDSIVKVWDMDKQYCTHNLRGSRGVVHLVQFHPHPDALRLYSSSVADCNIRVWDLRASR